MDILAAISAGTYETKQGEKLFQEDLEEKFNLTNYPLKDKVYEKAWSYGNAMSKRQAFEQYADLVELITPTLRKSPVADIMVAIFNGRYDTEQGPELFQSDLERKFNTENYARKERLFEKAWKDGHAMGLEEVHDYYAKLVEIIDPALLKSPETDSLSL